MQRRYYVLFVLGIALLALAFSSLALADTVEDPDENWCYAGGPWGNGRCSASSDPAVNEWYWTCGYWRAAVFANRVAWDAPPETCRVERRLVLLEFVNSDKEVLPPDDTDEDETDNETEPEPIPGIDIPVATATVTINYCTAEVGNNLTKLNVTISNYSSSSSSIGDVAKFRLNSSNNGNFIGFPEALGNDTFNIFLSDDYASFTDASIDWLDGGNFWLTSNVFGTINCDVNP